MTLPTGLLRSLIRWTPQVSRLSRGWTARSVAANAFERLHRFASTKAIIIPKTGTRHKVSEPAINEDEGFVPVIEELSAPSFSLRPYQEEAIAACLEALSSGLTRLGVSSPTGSGKTTMFMSLIPRITQPGKGRVLIIVSSIELAHQSEAAARRLLGDDWSIEVEQGKNVSSGRADVTVATYQTLNKEGRLDKFDPGKFKLIIVDEAHHAAAKSYMRMLHYFHQDVELPSMLVPLNGNDHGNEVPIIGFSATFSRPDQLALSAVFEKIVFHREISSMLQEGWLSPVKSTTVKAELNLEQVASNASGDFSTASLSRQMNTFDTNALIVRTYLHIASTRRSTLIFCVDLDHVAMLTQAFRNAGIDARSISSLSKADLRKATLEGFRNGEFRVLVNCEVLTEGADIPVIDCVILARPTKSKNLLAQMIGRGLRLSPESGKEDCHIIDVVDSMSGGIVATPSLLGLSHEEMEEVREPKEKEAGIAPEDLMDKLDPDKDANRNYRVTYIDEEDPFGVGTNHRFILAKITPYAWVGCGRGKWVMELFQNGYIQINEDYPTSDSTYTISHYRNFQLFGGVSKPYKSVRLIGRAENAERAIQAGDVYMKKTVGHELSNQMLRRAPWRQKPVGDKALAMLMKAKGVVYDPLEDDWDAPRIVKMLGKDVDLRKITAGEAASYICAAKHGAWTQRKATDNKAAKAQAAVDKTKNKKALAVRNLPLPTG